MKFSRIILVIFCASLLCNCASSYKPVNPRILNYQSTSTGEGVVLRYKYDLLQKKYAKKESKNGVRMVAVKITNTTEEDITIGKDLHFAFDSGKKAYVMGPEDSFKSLKQSPATHLLYLLLTPLNLYTTKTTGNRVETNSTPIGLVIGPGLAFGNMIAAGSANKKLKEQLYSQNIMGATVSPGKEILGVICIRSNSYDGLQLVKAFKPVENLDGISTK